MVGPVTAVVGPAADDGQRRWTGLPHLVRTTTDGPVEHVLDRSIASCGCGRSSRRAGARNRCGDGRRAEENRTRVALAGMLRFQVWAAESISTLAARRGRPGAGVRSAEGDARRRQRCGGAAATAAKCGSRSGASRSAPGLPLPDVPQGDRGRFHSLGRLGQEPPLRHGRDQGLDGHDRPWSRLPGCGSALFGSHEGRRGRGPAGVLDEAQSELSFGRGSGALAATDRRCHATLRPQAPPHVARHQTCWAARTPTPSAVAPPTVGRVGRPSAARLSRLRGQRASARARPTSPRWEKACGKFPTCRRACVSYSSASSPTSFAKPTSRSSIASASARRPCSA